MRYIANTEADRRAMLDAIGVSSLEELFNDIPKQVRNHYQPVGLPERSELETVREVQKLAPLNAAWQQYTSFLGGGVYDHYIPSVVSYITSRSEFSTAYTPYQPEMSQGTLTAMFEFQTLLCELTGMDVANSSMYDGATALAEAVFMAERIAKTEKVAVCRSLFPHYRRVLDTYCQAAGIEVVEVPYNHIGRYDTDSLPKGISALVVQNPNTFGIIEEMNGLKEQLGTALLIVAVNPISLGLISPPGEAGADIVVGEGQPLGLFPSFGGPFLGLFACRKQYLRNMPGRIIGRTVDAQGKMAYTMTSQTREQHIRRGRATSNICTNSTLCALAAAVYLAGLGGDGLQELALLNLEKAHYLAKRISSLPGYSLAFSGPFFNEFVIRVPGDPQSICRQLTQEKILLNNPSSLSELGVEQALNFAVTEQRTKEELDSLVDVLRDVT